MTDGDTKQTRPLLLRRDRAGRVRRSAQQRLEILAQYDRSGLTGPQFARVAGISYQTLATWLNKRREGVLALAEVDRRPVPLFVQAVAGPADEATTGLQIRFQGGASATITTPQQAQLAAVLVRALSGGEGC